MFQDTSEPFHPRPNLYASIQNHTKAVQHLNLLPIHLQFGQKIYFYEHFFRINLSLVTICPCNLPSNLPS